MIALDARTILISHTLTLGLAMLMIGWLWWQVRERATAAWALCFVAQFIAIVLLLARDSIPEPVSVMGSAFFAFGGLLALYLGLAHFFAARPSMRAPLAALVVLLAIHAWYTFVAPDLITRSINYSLGIGVYCALSAALIRRQAPAALRPASTLALWLLLAMVVISLLRALALATAPPTASMYGVGSASSMAILSYQLFTIAIAVAMLFLVNRRLNNAAAHELTERIASETALRVSEARLKRAELAAQVGNWELHLDDMITNASDGARRIYGVTEETARYELIRDIPLPAYRPVMDAALKRMLEHGDPYDVEFRIHTLDTGELKDIHSVAFFDPARRTIFGTIRDITALKDKQRALERLANFDTLTGLPNRAALADRLNLALAQSQRRQQSLAVAFIDLDGFKTVNDSHGHDVGDALLVALAHRLKGALREGDTLARVGGDEFIAVLVDLESFADAELVLRRLLEAAAQPIEVHAHTLQVSASIGVTLYPRDHTEADILLRHADQAMYQAKQAGKNQYRLYGPAG